MIDNIFNNYLFLEREKKTEKKPASAGGGGRCGKKLNERQICEMNVSLLNRRE